MAAADPTDNLRSISRARRDGRVLFLEDSHGTAYEIKLTDQEEKLIACLEDSYPRPQPLKSILKVVWGTDPGAIEDRRPFDSALNRLNERLKGKDLNPKTFIKNAGGGYVLAIRISHSSQSQNLPARNRYSDPLRVIPFSELIAEFEIRLTFEDEPNFLIEDPDSIFLTDEDARSKLMNMLLTKDVRFGFVLGEESAAKAARLVGSLLIQAFTNDADLQRDPITADQGRKRLGRRFRILFTPRPFDEPRILFNFGSKSLAAIYEGNPNEQSWYLKSHRQNAFDSAQRILSRIDGILGKSVLTLAPGSDPNGRLLSTFEDQLADRLATAQIPVDHHEVMDWLLGPASQPYLVTAAGARTRP